MLFGVIVVVEKYSLLKMQDRIAPALLHFYCMAVVVVSFGIFYFDDFARMSRFFYMQWGGASMLCDGVAEAAILDHFWLWVTAIVLCMPVRQAVANYFDQLTADMPVVNKSIGTLSRLVMSAAILLLCTALLVGATNNAFIYTRF